MCDAPASAHMARNSLFLPEPSAVEVKKHVRDVRSESPPLLCAVYSSHDVHPRLMGFLVWFLFSNLRLSHCQGGGYERGDLEGEAGGPGVLERHGTWRLPESPAVALFAELSESLSS